MLTEKNWQAVHYWHQAKATGGNLPLDELARENLGLIEGVMRVCSTAEQAQANTAAMAPLLAMVTGGSDGRRN